MAAQTLARRLFMTLAVLVAAPTAMFAQSGIAGVVRDPSGAVLPGVTVEAASPALIEKTRAVVTDGQGHYKVLDLRPGLYSVTFNLTGFSPVKREGIELPASFTATVNAEMHVGAVEETVTVSGAAPTVDVVNVVTQQVLSAQMLESIPAPRTPQAFAALLPGVNIPLGGIQGGTQELNTTIHGSRANAALFTIDGMSPTHQGVGGSAGYAFRISQSYVAELTIQTGAGSAEQSMGGMVTNVIPKEGSNTFSGSIYSEYSDHNLQADNLTDELRAKGLTSVSALRRMWDFSPAAGGPVLRDKLWFFTSFRQSGVIQTRAGLFENLTPKGWAYTPDLSRPAVIRIDDNSRNARLTWQITPRNKFSAFADIAPHIVYQFGYQSQISPEATQYAPYVPDH